MGAVITETSAAEVFEAMKQAFSIRGTHSKPGVCETYVRFADRLVRIRIAEQRVADQFLPPFAHLSCVPAPSQRPDLCIDLCEAVPTDHLSRLLLNRAARNWNQITVVSQERRFVGQWTPNALACLDREKNRILGMMNVRPPLFVYERAKPMAALLLEWHNDRKVQVIHAGLVSSQGCGGLLAGKSGSGKSTTALACLIGGLEFLGEDYIGLESTANGRFVGHSLYSSVFLEKRHFRRSFSGITGGIIRSENGSEEKEALVLSRLYPQRLAMKVPLQSIFLCNLTGNRATETRSATKGEALRFLAPTSLHQIPSRGASAFRRLADLVDQVPAYWLDLGSDHSSIAEKIKATLLHDDRHREQKAGSVSTTEKP